MNHLLSYAFRPLFFLAISYALVAVGWWGLAWSGQLPFPAVIANPVYWHAHEMIFGFAAAAIGGFALTAVANWTGRPPVAGLPIAVLCVFWLSARILAAGASTSLLLPLAVADLCYDLLLCGLLAREVISGDSQRNFKLIGVLALLTLANGAFYVCQYLQVDGSQTALWAGMWLVILLVNIIAGRIVPAFTGNWLTMQARLQQQPAPNRPPAFGTVDLVASLATAAFALAFLWRIESGITAALAAVACCSQLLRWSRWQFYRTLRDPMMWVLHLGFFWIPVGMALLGLAALEILPTSAGIHALTTGAITTMVMAVASRAALGHSNRPLANHPLLTISYVGITITTVLRITAAISDQAAPWMTLATLAWVISLGAFAWRYTPILLGPPARNPA